MGCEGTPPFCRSWGTLGTFELLPGCLCFLLPVSWPHPDIPKDQALSCFLLPCGPQKLPGAILEQRGESPPCFARWAAAALGTGVWQRGGGGCPPCSLKGSSQRAPVTVQHGGDAGGGGGQGGGNVTARRPWCFPTLNALLVPSLAPKRQARGRAKVVVNWGPPGPGLSGWAWTWCGSGLRSPCWLWQSEQCTAPLCASASPAALVLGSSPCLCFPARHVAMAHGHHRVCVSILSSSAESRAVVSWGPIYPFPSACLSLTERGTRCRARGHGDPAVPKGHCQPPSAPRLVRRCGSSWRPPLLPVTYGQTTPPE